MFFFNARSPPPLLQYTIYRPAFSDRGCFSLLYILPTARNKLQTLPVKTNRPDAGLAGDLFRTSLFEFGFLFFFFPQAHSSLADPLFLKAEGINVGDPEREFRKGRGWIRGNRPVRPLMIWILDWTELQHNSVWKIFKGSQE